MEYEQNLISYVRQVVQSSRDDLRRLSISDATPEGLVALEAQQSGVTIDLGHRSMSYMPEAVINAMKDDIERLAISHNSLTGFPDKLGDCVRLRYLNARYNKLREFPSAVLQLFSLEILDVSRNRLKSIPSEISALTSLKVLAISRNQIERLPETIGEMSSLRVLKLDHNPLQFPPPEIYNLDPNAPNPRKENEEVLTTSRVKRYLRESRRASKQTGGSRPSYGSQPVITSDVRGPPRRTAGMRFPVRPSLGGFESADVIGAPPVPARSHFRDKSIQPSRPSTSPGRPDVGARAASRSESVQSAALRSRRMGVLNDRAPDLSFLEGISMASGPNGPAPNQVPELSLAALLAEPQIGMPPEARLLHVANRLVFAYRQLRPLSLAVVQHMQTAAHSSFDDLSSVLAESLEAMAGLAGLVTRFDPTGFGDGDRPNSLAQRIQSQCRICFATGSRLWSGFASRSREIMRHCPPGLLRMFTLSLYGVLVEVRDSMAVLGIELVERPSSFISHAPQNSYGYGSDGAQQQSHEHQRQQSQQLRNPLNDSNHDQIQPNIPSNMAIPRNLGGYSGHNHDLPPALAPTTVQIDHIFAQLYIRLKSTTTLAQSSVPELQQAFSRERDMLLHHPEASAAAAFWARLAILAERLLGATISLNQRLANARARDPVLRQQTAFWSLIRTYCDSWYDLVAGIQDSGLLGPLQSRIRVAMKPLHRANKELILAIDQSPWRDMLTRSLHSREPSRPSLAMDPNGTYNGNNYPDSNQSYAQQMHLDDPSLLIHSHPPSDFGYPDPDTIELQTDPGSDDGGDSFLDHLSAFPPDYDPIPTAVPTPLTSMHMPRPTARPSIPSSYTMISPNSSFSQFDTSAFPFPPQQQQQQQQQQQPLESPALSAVNCSPSLLPAMLSFNPTNNNMASSVPSSKAISIPAKPNGIENDYPNGGATPTSFNIGPNLGSGLLGRPTLPNNPPLLNGQFSSRANSIRR